MALSKVVKKCLHVLLSGTHIILIIFPACPQFWIAQLGGNWKEDRWEQDDCVRKVWELCPGNSFLECFTLIAAVEDFSCLRSCNLYPSYGNGEQIHDWGKLLPRQGLLPCSTVCPPSMFNCVPTPSGIYSGTRLTPTLTELSSGTARTLFCCD